MSFWTTRIVASPIVVLLKRCPVLSHLIVTTVREDAPPDVVAQWPQPNFVNPVTAGPALNVIAILFKVLAYLFVGLRIYVRAYLLRSFGIDDWMMVICLVCCLTESSNLIALLTIPTVPSTRIGNSSVHLNIIWLGDSCVGPAARMVLPERAHQLDHPADVRFQHVLDQNCSARILSTILSAWQISLVGACRHCCCYGLVPGKYDYDNFRVLASPELLAPAKLRWLPDE